MEISKLLAEFKKDSLKIEDVASSILARIDKVEPKVCGFAHFDKQKVHDRAKKLSKEKQQGRLYGIPMAVKDNICVEGELTTCSSKILDGFKSPYDATVVSKLYPCSWLNSSINIASISPNRCSHASIW